MNELPKRKPNRLKDYDYSQNGAYFVTICTQNRENLFSAVTVGADRRFSEATALGRQSISSLTGCIE